MVVHPTEAYVPGLRFATFQHRANGYVSPSEFTRNQLEALCN